MDDEDFDFADLAFMPDTARRFRKVDLVCLGLGFLQGIAATVNDAAINAYNLAAMHANYKNNEHAFAEQAALEIETLIAGEEE